MSGHSPKIIGDKPENYGGDVTPEEAWRVLSAEPRGGLVDVRTSAEWAYVGIPDLTTLGRQTLLIEWQHFPDMARNDDFAAEAEARLLAAGVTKDKPVFMICRSGSRSRAAAVALTRRGFSQSFNVAEGFEGDLDDERHRGGLGGWKAVGLPWHQS